MDKADDVYLAQKDKTIACYTSGSSTYVAVNDTSFTDADAFKTAMSGVYLVYELATPTTESADPYQEAQIVDNWGTEEYVDSRTVPMPVGHETFYQLDLKAKVETLPNPPSGDGLYLVKSEDGILTFVQYLNELPSDPEDDGTYTLKLTKSGSTVTTSWVADE